MNAASWPAPAKLNLFLHITGRRIDGYHELQTVFQFLDYGDELRFTVRPDGEVNALHCLPEIDEQDDLVVRAARLLQRVTDTPWGADIHLDKRLPMGGGLGGGSSDAATTLVALNYLWKTDLSRKELAALGLRLGADVPVFIAGQAAWAEGVGEQLTPIVLAEPWYVVLVSCAVSTAEIFAAPDLTRDSRPIKIHDFLAGQGGNDCTAAVCRRYPEVGAALQMLGNYGQARMSGTGSCVFAACANETEARQVLDRLADTAPKHWRGFVAKGLNQSPLWRLPGTRPD